MLDTTEIVLTEHARERWEERIGRPGFDVAARGMVSASRRNGERAAIIAWYRGRVGGGVSIRDNVVFVNKEYDAAFMTKFEGRGKVIVLSVARLSVCISVYESAKAAVDDPSNLRLRRKRREDQND